MEIVATVQVETEIVAVVENLVTLTSEALVYLRLRDFYGRIFYESTVLLPVEE